MFLYLSQQNRNMLHTKGTSHSKAIAWVIRVFLWLLAEVILKPTQTYFTMVQQISSCKGEEFIVLLSNSIVIPVSLWNTVCKITRDTSSIYSETWQWRMSRLFVCFFPLFSLWDNGELWVFVTCREHGAILPRRVTDTSERVEIYSGHRARGLLSTCSWHT